MTTPKKKLTRREIASLGGKASAAARPPARKPCVVRLDEDDKAWCDGIAAARKTDRSTVIRDAIAFYRGRVK